MAGDLSCSIHRPASPLTAAGTSASCSPAVDSVTPIDYIAEVDRRTALPVIDRVDTPPARHRVHPPRTAIRPSPSLPKRKLPHAIDRNVMRPILRRDHMVRMQILPVQPLHGLHELRPRPVTTHREASGETALQTNRTGVIPEKAVIDRHAQSVKMWMRTQQRRPRIKLIVQKRRTLRKLRDPQKWIYQVRT